MNPGNRRLRGFFWGGVHTDTGYRRFRTAIVELAWKNGNSTWAAGIALYLTIADGEQGAEAVSVAVKRDQARLVHGEAARMVAKSPSISKVLKRGRDSKEIRECAEVDFVSGEKREQKSTQPLRYVAIRSRPRQEELFVDGCREKHFAVGGND